MSFQKNSFPIEFFVPSDLSDNEKKSFISSMLGAKQEDLEITDAKADNAQTTADNAQTTADNAQTTAESADTKADNAQTTANNALSLAEGASPRDARRTIISQTGLIELDYSEKDTYKIETTDSIVIKPINLSSNQVCKLMVIKPKSNSVTFNGVYSVSDGQQKGETVLIYDIYHVETSTFIKRINNKKTITLNASNITSSNPTYISSEFDYLKMEINNDIALLQGEFAWQNNTGGDLYGVDFFITGLEDIIPKNTILIPVTLNATGYPDPWSISSLTVSRGILYYDILTKKYRLRWARVAIHDGEKYYITFSATFPIY